MVAIENQESTHKRKRLSKSKETLINAQDSFETIEQLWNCMSSIGIGSRSIFSKIRYSDIEQYLTKNSNELIKELGHEFLTTIQAKTLCTLLSFISVDLVSKTGSGKTLAYLLPIFENLATCKFKHTYGTGAIILAPTRELCFQIHDLASRFALKHSRSCVLLVSGAGGFAEEQRRILKGGAIIVATPGRLLQHLTETDEFVYDTLTTLVLDEADKMVKEGFTDQLKQIISIIKDRNQELNLQYKNNANFPRQVIAATATITPEVMEMISLFNVPLRKTVDLTNDGGYRTNTTLKQRFMIVPSPHRFTVLCNFLRLNLNKKIMVFMSTCKGVSYFQNVVSSVFGMSNTLALQGEMEQKQRSKIFFGFCKSKGSVLFCTDIAARGLDIQSVDYIVQYDPPYSADEYVHRVGRTARAGHRGEAVLFLRSEEKLFLEHLTKAGLNMKEHCIEKYMKSNCTEKLQECVDKNAYLAELANEAFRKYLRSYHSHPMKRAFDISFLNFQHVSESFGFRQKPDLTGLGLSNLRTSRSNATPKRFKFLTSHVTMILSDEEEAIEEV